MDRTLFLVAEFLKEYGNVPNFFTLSRIAGLALLVPLILGGYYLWGLILFLALAATDFVDGWVARKFNLVTALGKFLDPLADKVLILTTLFYLIGPELMLGFYVLLSMEGALFVVSAVAYVYQDSGRARLGANWFGKSKAFVEIFLTTLFFLEKLGLAIPGDAFRWVLYAAIAAASASFSGHFRARTSS